MWVAIRLRHWIVSSLQVGPEFPACCSAQPRPGPAQTLGGTGLRDGSEQRLPRESWER